ncbi:MAG: hypothetical protein H7832_14935, partial [Magnetococcus sp. DMHC-6]
MVQKGLATTSRQRTWMLRFWVSSLICLILLGAKGYLQQLHQGLEVTGMTDQLLPGFRVGSKRLRNTPIFTGSYRRLKKNVYLQGFYRVGTRG